MSVRFRFSCLFVAVSLTIPAVCSAQDDQPIVVDEITAVVTEEAPFEGVFYTAVPAENNFVSLEWDAASLIDWPQVAEEIEIVEDQRLQIQKLRNEMHARMQASMKRISESQKSGGHIDHQKVMKQMQKIQVDVKKKVNEEILLPHQVDRLKQLGLQVKMRHAGPGAALFNKQLATELKITDGQRKRIEQAAKDAQAHVRKEFERIQKEAREKVMAELTETQREKLNQMLGNPIDLSQPRESN